MSHSSSHKIADYLLASQDSDGGIGGSGPGRQPAGARQDSGRALPRMGAVGALPRGARKRSARREGLPLPAVLAPGRRRLGLAGGAHRFGGAPVEPPGHRHGLAGLCVGEGTARITRSSAGGRAARHALPATGPLRGSQGALVLGNPDRAALLHRRARRARHHHQHRPRQGELRGAHRRGVPAIAAGQGRPVVSRARRSRATAPFRVRPCGKPPRARKTPRTSRTRSD